MPDADLPAPQLITRTDELNRLAGILAQEPIVAVDTESNSLYVYHEQVCLLQFSTPQVDALVDPLALEDLSPLAPFFANPKIEKVFHAAEYDLICLKRDFGLEFATLFDTMMAATILGKNELGLATLLEGEFGIQIDKRYQRANWGERPLPAHLLSYARLDTHYLIPLRHRLHAELSAQGRLNLAAEDFARLCITSGRNSETGGTKNSAGGRQDTAGGGKDTAGCWRINGAYKLSYHQAAVLNELCHYRDQAAQSLNKPLFKVIHDAALLEIAATCPQSLGQLKRVPGMTEGQIRRHGKGILQAVQRGQQAPPIQPPCAPRPDEHFLARLENLRQWRKSAAYQMGVKSDVVLPRDLMFDIAEKNPQGIKNLAGILELSPWRLEHYGNQILKVLSQS